MGGSINIKEFEHISNSNITGTKSTVYAVDFTKNVDTSCEFEMKITVNL